jgi:MFS family permease
VAKNLSGLADYRPSKDAWWTLVVLFIFYTLSMTDRYIMALMAPSIRESVHLTDTEMGLILGPAFSFAYAIFGLPIGWAVDRYSRRLVLFVGVFLFGCATSTTALANSFLALLVARGLVGIGEAAVSPAAYSLLTDKFPRRMQTTTSAIFNTAAPVGTMAAYLLGPAAVVYAVANMPGTTPWRFAFVVLGAGPIIAAFLAFTFREGVRTKVGDGQASSDKAWQYIIQNRGLMFPLIFGFMLLAMNSATLIAWTPTYITRHFKSEIGEFGPMLSIISLMAALTLIFKGLVVDFLITRGIKDAYIRVFIWLLAAIVPPSVALYTVDDLNTFMWLYGIVFIIATPLQVFFSATLQVVVPPQIKGRIITIFFLLVVGVGGGTGPLITGALAEHVYGGEAYLGAAMATMLLFALIVGGICLMLCLKPLRRRLDSMEREAQEEAGAPELAA